MVRKGLSGRALRDSEGLLKPAWNRDVDPTRRQHSRDESLGRAPPFPLFLRAAGPNEAWAWFDNNPLVTDERARSFLSLEPRLMASADKLQSRPGRLLVGSRVRPRTRRRPCGTQR
jgi:hypothetical protein